MTESRRCTASICAAVTAPFVWGLVKSPGSGCRTMCTWWRSLYDPMPYQAAREMEVEVELAIGLREAGGGVWQA